MRDSIEVGPGIRITAGGAAWLPEHETLVIADVHLGYARAARRRGGYLPQVESPLRVADRVAALAARFHATRLVIAGDLRHSTRDVDAAELAEVEAFLARVAGLVGPIALVAGNHDRGAAMLPSVSVGDVDVVHEPPRQTPARWTIAGHLHPSTAVRDETGAGARFPCALVGTRLIVLPAFTEWAGGARVGRLLGRLPDGPWRRIATTQESVLPLDALRAADAQA